MRIISSWHDYYDPLCKFDGDRETLYMRESKKAQAVEFPRIWMLDHSQRLLKFCDRIYNVMRMNMWCRKDGEQAWVTKTCFHERLALDFAQEHMRADDWRRLCRRKWGLIRDIKRFFEWKPKDDFPSTPVWWAHKTQETVLNPCIREVVPEFVSILPPAQAYQELVMWHGKQARPEPPIPHIDDVTMAEAKGFDKFSFRKDKQS